MTGYLELYISYQLHKKLKLDITSGECARSKPAENRTNQLRSFLAYNRKLGNSDTSTRATNYQVTTWNIQNQSFKLY